MKREEKDAIIDSIRTEIEKHNHFYLTDISDLLAADTSALRRECFKQNIKLVVVKNTLLQKALEKSKVGGGKFDELLKGHTSVMFTDQGSVPAKMIKEFRKKHLKPLLKGAFVEESVYIGENQLDVLMRIKTKNELIGDIVVLLQSPIRTVISQLQSGANTLVGVLETLSNKPEIE